MRPTFPATLLDYNGVLVDDEAIHLAALRETLAPLGIDVEERAYWERYVGLDDTRTFATVLEDAGRPPSDRLLRRLVQSKHSLYLRRASAELKPFPGAAELVRRRARAGPVGVVSGALKNEIELGMDVLGVRHLVCSIVSADDTSRCKPDPEGYRKGLSLLRSTPTGETSSTVAVVVEDSVAGIRAARAAGLTCIAVAHTHSESTLSSAGPARVVADLTLLSEAFLSDLYTEAHG